MRLVSDNGSADLGAKEETTAEPTDATERAVLCCPECDNGYFILGTDYSVSCSWCNYTTSLLDMFGE